MKTITAKEFQLKHAAILKEVARGHEYEVTFHRKPLVRLVPAQAKTAKTPLPGSHAARLKSSQNTFQSSGELQTLPYAELRKRMVLNKYGDS